MASHGQDQIQSRDPISNPLSRQGSLKNIYDDLKTIDTLDEPLKIVWTADDINQFGEGVEGESSTVLLNQQSTLSSKRTIDEPLQDMYEETTWADLFAKVAMVSDWDGGEKILGPNAADSMGTSMLPIMSTHPFQQTITVTDAMGMPQHPQCSNYQLSPMQPQSMLPVMSTHPIQQTIADAMGMPQHPQCSNYQMSPMQTQSMLPVMSTHPIQQTISDAMGLLGNCPRIVGKWSIASNTAVYDAGSDAHGRAKYPSERRMSLATNTAVFVASVLNTVVRMPLQRLVFCIH